MTYYNKQRMESFKKAMFASRISGKVLTPSRPVPAPRPLAS